MEALERSGQAWFITGSEALAAYGSPRQTMDVDVVVDASPGQLADLATTLVATHYHSELGRYRNRTMPARIDMGGAGKVDLIARAADRWG